MKQENLTADEKHAIIIEGASDKKANYITTIDLRGKTLIADYFVTCVGTSNIHIRAIADGIMESMEKHGHRPETLEGYSEATWVLVSYGDVIAHIMNETQRDYYKLEKLWSNMLGPAGHLPDADLSEDASFEEESDNEDDDEPLAMTDDFGEADISDVESGSESDLKPAS